MRRLVPRSPRSVRRLPAYLQNILFPASRRDILRIAEDNEAPDAILDAIEELPERRYWSVQEIITKMRPGASL